MRLLSESTRQKICLSSLNVRSETQIPSRPRTVTIEIAVEGLHSESVRKIQFVLIDVDLKVALDENGGVVVDVN